MAVRKIFSMHPAEHFEADRLLTQAYDIDPSAVFLAWKSQLRLMQLVERKDIDQAATREAIAHYCARAIEADPRNSVVLAIAANTRLFRDLDVGACHARARQSVRANGANPLAWHALSVALLYSDKKEEAHLAAARARVLGRGSPYEFWWDMGRSLTAVLAASTGEATAPAEKFSVLCGNLHPPLRYLAGLRAAEADSESAEAAAALLRRPEPDSTFERLVGD